MLTVTTPPVGAMLPRPGSSTNASTSIACCSRLVLANGAEAARIEAVAWRRPFVDELPGLYRELLQAPALSSDLRCSRTRCCSSTIMSLPKIGNGARGSALAHWLVRVIRCRKSLEMLGALSGSRVPSRSSPRPAFRFRLPRFRGGHRQIATCQFGGPYRNPEDLPELYGDVHFCWTLDYYEEGQNSAWLLPNRVYEGTLYGAVPIAWGCRNEPLAFTPRHRRRARGAGRARAR